MRKAVLAGGVAGTVLTGSALGLILGIPAIAGAHSGGPKAGATVTASTSTPFASGDAKAAGGVSGSSGGASFSAGSLFTPPVAPKVTVSVSGAGTLPSLGTLKSVAGSAGDPLATLATVLGITEDALKSALASGQSLAAIATAHHVSVQTVINTLVGIATTQVNAAVSAGLLPQAFATDIIAKLPTLMAALVNHAIPALPGGSLPQLGTLPNLGAIPGLGSIPGMGSIPGLGSIPGFGSLPALPGTGTGGSLPGTGAIPGLPSIPGVTNPLGLISSILGISQSTLQSKLSGGQSLQSIVSAHGMSLQALFTMMASHH